MVVGYESNGINIAVGSRARQTLSSILVENRVSSFTRNVTASFSSSIYIRGCGDGRAGGHATAYECGGDDGIRKTGEPPAETGRAFSGDVCTNLNARKTPVIRCVRVKM